MKGAGTAVHRGAKGGTWIARHYSAEHGPLSSYFRLLGSANLSGSRSDVMVRPMVLLSAAASQAIGTVAVATRIAFIKYLPAPPRRGRRLVGSSAADRAFVSGRTSSMPK